MVPTCADASVVNDGLRRGIERGRTLPNAADRDNCLHRLSTILFSAFTLCSAWELHFPLEKRQINEVNGTDSRTQADLVQWDKRINAWAP